ncbi:DUF1778 domain-containing protein [Mycobacterium malmoense]|uniref:Toxin-antitoxin system protein n=1 Tax=Mycobacterium malmoense TaxID=1780 RepID=A0ABX3SW51_MYCMA|nr:DUF1778 domain-containing protein [Mycobacterium malmoense]OIN82400.1 hypothetical protein BMG05_02645 [Mycobacterium malmoense]ORA84861.1 hypothetical protein BST29_04765 [Mycobacterium malmoense]QZA19658.1 DUF1778 domain-containing protein [Mycobacterium malmoense]UNB96410.1 DUF1778 domain-containing protein [Mycobacterium malmoense]
MASTERLHFRVRADAQARLRCAAEMEHQTLTEFVLSAAEERAESVLSRQTTLSAEFFDAMFNALSEPPRPNAAMRRIARSPRVSRHG